ncbi:MAG: hypothetical protein NVSMB52_02130 [Chloroflexota bacterium]
MDARFIYSLLFVLVAAVAIGLATGRSQSQSLAAAPTSLPTAVPTSAANTINIVPNSSGEMPGRYEPAVLTVHVGQTVTFKNTTDIDHTATADNSAFNTDVLGPNGSSTWTPTRAGKYLYGCYFHPTMRGEIDVQP